MTIWFLAGSVTTIVVKAINVCTNHIIGSFIVFAIITVTVVITVAVVVFAVAAADCVVAITLILVANSVIAGVFVY